MSHSHHPSLASPVHHHRHHQQHAHPEYHPSIHPDHPDSPGDGPQRDPPPQGYGPPPYGGYQYPPPTYGAPYGLPAGAYYNYPAQPPPPHYGSVAGGGSYGPPPPHYYGYSYPSQHPANPPSDQKRRKSPSRRTDKERKPPMSSQLAEDIELERMRAAAEPVQVKPMRTEFHFFVDDMRDEIRLISENKLGRDALNKFLLHTDMNARLMKAWEDATDETRSKYLIKEEEDRRRFMAEDEIASRHCATLTARARSPRGKDDEDGDYDDYDEEDDDDEIKKRSPQKNLESPPKKSKADDEHASVLESRISDQL